MKVSMKGRNDDTHPSGRTERRNEEQTLTWRNNSFRNRHTNSNCNVETAIERLAQKKNNNKNLIRSWVWEEAQLGCTGLKPPLSPEAAPAINTSSSIILWGSIPNTYFNLQSFSCCWKGLSDIIRANFVPVFFKCNGIYFKFCISEE